MYAQIKSAVCSGETGGPACRTGNAAERIRTSTGFLPLDPKSSASAISATAAANYSVHYAAIIVGIFSNAKPSKVQCPSSPGSRAEARAVFRKVYDYLSRRLEACAGIRAD